MLWMVVATLGGVSEASEFDLGTALEQPRKAKWDPKGKAIGPYGRGTAQRDQPEAAIPLLVQSLEVQPGCGKCLNALGSSLRKAEAYDQAVQVGELLIALYPDKDEGYTSVLRAQALAERWSETADAAAAALAKNDPGSMSYLWTMRTDALIKAGRSEEAARLLNEEMTEGVKDADVGCMKVLVATAQGDAGAATEAWATCEESEYLSLKRGAEGWLAISEGRREHGAKRVAMSGGDEELARVALAWSRLEGGEGEAALNLVNKAIEDGRMEWDVLLFKAEALASLERLDEASETLAMGPLADDWASVDAPPVLMLARGPEWPKMVAMRSAALQIAIHARSENPDGASALHAEAVAAYGEHPIFDKALGSAEGDGDE